MWGQGESPLKPTRFFVFKTLIFNTSAGALHEIMQLMLRHDVASLLQTLNLIDESLQKVTFRRIFDRAVLQLSRKQLRQRIEDEIDESESPGKELCVVWFACYCAQVVRFMNSPSEIAL